MILRGSYPRGRLASGLLMATLLLWPASLDADSPQLGNITFSGQATVVKATVLGVTTIISDTGPLPSSGGAQQASLLSASVDGLLTAHVAHATTIGQGDRSRSEASAADLTLTLPGNNTISADFLMAKAAAVCAPGGPSVSGSSEIVGLVINGQAIVVSGDPNQAIVLPGGAGVVMINEQQSSVSGNKGDITVNALHVVINNPLGGARLADTVISSAHADISCAGPVVCNGSDLVTGGGWITLTPSGAKGSFAVAGGIKNGSFWGHLEYLDHGPNGPKVHGTAVTAYTVTGPTTRHIEGTAEVNGQGGFTYKVDVADNGEPGRDDTFSIKLSNGYFAAGTLGGGNIQLHTPCK